MLIKMVKIVVVLAMLAGLVGAGYFWNETRKRDQEILVLNDALDKANKRMRATQKKYIQEKAKLGTCMRVKMAEAAKRVQYQKQAKLLAAENQALAEQKEGLVKKYQAGIGAWEKKVEKVRVLNQKLAQRYEILVGKYKDQAQDNREKTGQIRTLEGDKKGLESNVVRLERGLERNRKHNERLCVIAEELTVKYREKTKYDAEPFTKLGMIELEHMLQEYIKRIDKEKLVEQ